MLSMEYLLDSRTEIHGSTGRKLVGSTSRSSEPKFWHGLTIGICTLKFDGYTSEFSTGMGMDTSQLYPGTWKPKFLAWGIHRSAYSEIQRLPILNSAGPLSNFPAGRGRRFGTIPLENIGDPPIGNSKRNSSEISLLILPQISP
jgi:hypothetical protein